MNTQVAKLSIAAIAALGLWAWGGEPARAQNRICTRDPNGRLNMRQAPSTGTRVLAQIPNGTPVSSSNVVTGGDGYPWHLVSYAGYRGWVRGDFLCSARVVRPARSWNARVCTRSANGILNVRSGPSTGTRVVAQLSNRSPINAGGAVTGGDGFPWYQINGIGWARGDFICF